MKKVFAGYDNPIYIEFDFTSLDPNEVFTLNTFTEIKISLDWNQWSTVNEPDRVKIIDANTLRLNLGDVSVFSGYLEIVGYSLRYKEGYVLTNKCSRNLEPIHICKY